MKEVTMRRVCLQRDYHVYFGIIKFNYFLAQIVSLGDARNTYEMKQCGHWCLYFCPMSGEIRFNCNSIQLQVRLPNCKRVSVPQNRKWPFRSLIFQLRQWTSRREWGCGILAIRFHLMTLFDQDYQGQKSLRQPHRKLQGRTNIHHRPMWCTVRPRCHRQYCIPLEQEQGKGYEHSPH